MRSLRVGSDLFIGDEVITDGRGLVQIKFSDKTELVVGPNSKLVLEDYLLRDDGSAGNFAINALSGTFRFATGVAPKERYELKTPGGTIGIRGTALDFTVERGETQVMLYHGAATLCARNGKCVTLDDACEVGTYSFLESEVVGISRFAGRAERRELRAAFRYAYSQRPLRREFRIDSAESCLVPQANVPEQRVAETQRDTAAPAVPPDEEPPGEEPPGEEPPVDPPDDPDPVKPPKEKHNNGNHYGQHKDESGHPIKPPKGKKK